MTRSPSRSRAVRAAALAVGLACAAVPAAAQAESIVYVDGGNVWSATPDGSHKVQLTTGGTWHSPTQADDGTIAAVQGTGPIVVMARDGRPLRTITTPSAPSGDGGTFAPRPVELAFSPDGTKLAYAYVAGSCPVASTCGTTQRSTFYTDANVSEATPISTYGEQFSVSSPSWVTNTRTLVSGGAGSQVAYDDLGPGDDTDAPWLTPDGRDMGDPEVSRDGKHLAATFDYGADTLIAFFATKGDVATGTPPAQPDAACNTGSGDAQHADPTWAPDGMGIAYHSSKGIEVGRFTKLDASGCAMADAGSVLTATGSEPDWGPADPPAAAYRPPVTIDDPPPPPPPSGSTLGLAKTPKVTVAALRKGLVVSVRAAGAGKVSVKLGSVAKGAATARAAGTVRVRLGKVAAKKARALRGRKLKLVVTQAGAANRVTVTVKVR